MLLGVVLEFGQVCLCKGLDRVVLCLLTESSAVLGMPEN